MEENLETLATYEPVGWENAEITKEATVTIDGIEYEVTPRIVNGKTPVNATNLSHMDDAIQENREAINDLYNGGATTKASDTLPIGSVVEFDGDTIPDGWEEVENYKEYSLTSEISLTGNSSCESKNGICYFSMALRPAESEIPAYSIIATGLPKPKKTIGFVVVNGTGSAIRMQVTIDGSLSNADKMTTATNYLGSVSYVIDEEV